MDYHDNHDNHDNDGLVEPSTSLSTCDSGADQARTCETMHDRVSIYLSAVCTLKCVDCTIDKQPCYKDPLACASADVPHCFNREL